MMTDIPVSIRIMIIDDHPVVRAGLASMLSTQPGISVVGSASSGQEALLLLDSISPDVILMDLRMPVMGGVEATRRVVAATPSARVVVLTTFEEDEEIFEALRAGAVGYLLKACSADKLNESVRAAAKGTSVLEPAVTAKLMAELNRLSAREGRKPAQALADPLSDRELAVLRLLAEGCSNKEIGSRLNITEGTVKNHMTNILGKLGVLDRTQAALRAREMGLL